MYTHFLDNGQAPLAKASVVVAPIPFEGAISYLPGAKLGPEAILSASSQVELYDYEHDVDLSREKIHTITQHPTLASYADVREYVSGVVNQVNSKTQFYLGLGGDHTVTIPAIEVLSKRYKKLGIVQIDAHADLRDELHGNRYSHACIMRRNAELIGAKNILAVGIRAVSQEEQMFISKNKVNTIAGNFSLDANLVPRLKALLKKIPDDVFLTVDLDGLDPTIMPHVGTPVPGGLSWFQTLSVIREVFRSKNVVAADVVEIASSRESARSDFTAALLCQKIIAFNKLKTKSKK